MSKVKLLPHQVDALKMTQDLNKVAYYLDMGLGKTFVGSEKMKQLGTDLNILVCQKSKIDDWYEHFKEFYPECSPIKWRSQKEIPKGKVVIIINYDLIWRRPSLKKANNFTLILDESSYIKNPTSKRSKFICRLLKPKNVILLSGTPCGGKYEELLSQVQLLGWNITKKLYWNKYVRYVEMNVGGFKIPKVIGYKNVPELKQKLRDIGCVFMKTEEVITLPEQLHNVEYVKTTKDYTTFEKDDLVTLKDGTELVGDMSLTKLLYLRQLAAQYNQNKIDKLKDLLESTEDRVVIFYNFDAELNIIQDVCKKLKKPFSQINGSVKDVRQFRTMNNGVVACQYQAASMGHNLQESNKIIYFSLTCSSELFEQSKKRTHRIGQKRTCSYWYLITKNSIEEKIYKVLQERRDYTEELFKEDKLI